MSKSPVNVVIQSLKNNKLLFSALCLVFILYLITYPSIHNLTDEYFYLNISKQLCEGDLSFYEQDKAIPAPLHFTVLCLTSPLHNYEITTAEMVTFFFTIMMVVGWYFTLPKTLDKKKFTILLFGNSLLWTYSFRVLPDLPMAFFLSLGILNFYLYLEKKKKKHSYMAILFLSLAMLTKELALIYLPILLAYMVLSKSKLSIKALVLLILPILPYIIYASLIGNLNITKYFLWAAGIAEDRTASDYATSIIPYKDMPALAFIAGVFGPGLFSCLYIWKNSFLCFLNKLTFGIASKIDLIKKHAKENLNLLKLSLIVYLAFEVAFIVLPFNAPRFNITLIPFVTLAISEGANKNKYLKWLYYLALLYTIASGFVINYYFHIAEGSIWQDSLVEIIRKITG